MDKNNLEEYLQDILKKVEKVVEEDDEQTIEDLTSYIHMSKDIIRYYKTTDNKNPLVEQAYLKINEAEEQMMNIARLKYRPGIKFDIKEVFNTFVESLRIFSKG